MTEAVPNLLRHMLGAIRIDRDVVIASGPEAAAYLQGQLSQDVDALAVGESARSFVLQPQGKVVAWLRVSRTGDESFVLDTEPGAGEGLLDRLQRFKLRTKVDFELATWSCVALRGAGAVAAAAGLDRTATGIDAVAPAGWPGLDGAAGVDLLGPDVAIPIGAAEAPATAYEALRIESGVPAMGSEATEATIPAELGTWVINASVSFTKGCYTGQELVARIDSRGSQVPRPVRGLRLERTDVPPPGAVLHVADATPAETPREVGHVTSSAWSPRLDCPIALAVVARSVAVGTEVGVTWEGGGAVAQVVALPFAGSG